MRALWAVGVLAAAWALALGTANADGHISAEGCAAGIEQVTGALAGDIDDADARTAAEGGLAAATEAQGMEDWATCAEAVEGALEALGMGGGD